MSFARFYFMSDAQLISLHAEATTAPQHVERYLASLFPGVHQLQVDERGVVTVPSHHRHG